MCAWYGGSVRKERPEKWFHVSRLEQTRLRMWRACSLPLMLGIEGKERLGDMSLIRVLGRTLPGHRVESKYHVWYRHLCYEEDSESSHRSHLRKSSHLLRVSLTHVWHSNTLVLLARYVHSNPGDINFETLSVYLLQDVA